MIKIRFAIAAALIGAVSTAHAAQVTAVYETLLDFGHRAEGTIIYDDTLPVASASGLGPTDGIEFLDVTFFDPGNNELFSVVDVTGGESSYSSLAIEFDTTTPNFVSGSGFDIGENTGTPGELYLDGVVGGVSNLFTVPDGDVIDSTKLTLFTVTIIPEPSAALLFALALSCLSLRRPR